MMLFIRRAAAYLVDIVILFAILGSVGFLIQQLLDVTMAQTGPEIGRTILWNFSIPAWLYFIISDSTETGATLGKRLLNLQVQTETGESPSLGRALGRNAIKLLPWELAHISAFTLSEDLAQFSSLQIGGMVIANLLILVYLGLAVATKGQRSVHDFVVDTKVQPLTGRESPEVKGVQNV